MSASTVPFGDLYERALVLDGRVVPGSRARIDHLVVAASGVWVIDVNDITGRVARRDLGGAAIVGIRLLAY